MTKQFAHLHVHTEYSMLDGATKTKALFAEVERLGMPAVAMTDHGNMFGAYEFFKRSTEHAVKPILGIEAYVAPEGRFHKKPVHWGRAGVRGAGVDGSEAGKDVAGGGRFTHMTILAKDAPGLRNLFRLSTLASFEGQYPSGKARMDVDLISEYSTGLIGTTGCPSGAVQTRLRLGQWEEAVRVAATYQDILGKENYFLELMDHGLGIENQVRDDLLRLAAHLGIPLLATNDSHYVTIDQADAHDSLLCIGTGKNKADVNRLKFSGSDFYIKPASEMRRIFSELPAACDNTLLIAEMVESYESVFTYVDRMPQFDVPEEETQESWLRKQVEKGLAARYGTPIPKHVLERYETEMAVIGPMGFSPYFLIVADICAFARANKIMVGPGRGSATGSIVAYATRITELDPLEHKLLFERFLNPDRISPPDVDLDFDDRHRDRMVRYVSEKYGAAFTAQVNTFGTIKAKAAIKDSSRILGYPFAMGDRTTKVLPPDVMGKGVELRDIFEKSHPRYGEAAEFRRLVEVDPDVKKVYETALGVEGLIRGSGVHAAAVIISSEPLIDVVPMHMRASDGTTLTGFAYPQCEDMGLMKMDFLGLRNLGVIDHAINIVKENRGADIDPLALPLDDAKTYHLLARGDTLGVFQLDGGPMRSLLRQMEPSRFEDIAAVLALYRPGPMAANAHTDYAMRKTGRQKITPIHAELEEVLEPILGTTFHLLVYQEQIMAVAREVAGYTLGGADLLRRAMGKKKPEVLAAEFENFKSGMHARGYSADAVEALWGVMLPFAGYAFNKSHTAGYGLVSYWTAYLKANFPAEYAAALLTSVGDDKDKMAVYLADARSMGIKVLQPDVNESVASFTAVGDSVRFGLQAVRNVGSTVIESLVRSREAHGPFDSFADFISAAPLPVCNKRAVDSLIKAGAFDSLGHTRLALSAVADFAIDSVVGVKRAAEVGQEDLFGLMDEAEPSPGLDFELSSLEWPRSELLTLEREMLGLYVSGHPLDGNERVLARARDITIAQVLSQGQENDDVVISGMITTVDRRMSKSGNAWAMTTIEDQDASVKVNFFSQAYLSAAADLAQDSIVSVTGKVQKRDDGIAIMARGLTLLDVSSVKGGYIPVTISLPLNKVKPQLIVELRGILQSHRGDNPVILRLESPGRSDVLMEVPKFPVQVDNSFFSEIKELLGVQAIGR